jgi:proline iminopeptidase
MSPGAQIRLTVLATCFAACSSLGCLSTDTPGTLVPPTADQDPALPQRSLSLAGRSVAIHAASFGDPARPALFLLHDALADYRAFAPFEALADRYFVVMWDRRGDGLSERFTEEAYSPDTLVEEIDALKAIHSPNAPISLIGHGFGATYAALYISRRPTSVRQAVLMEPAPLTGAVYGALISTVFDDAAEGMDDAFDHQSTWNATVSRMLWASEVLTPSNHEELDYKALSFVVDQRWNGLHCDNDNPAPFPIWRPGGFVEYLRDEMLVGEDDGSDNDYRYNFSAGLDKYPTEVRFLVGSCSMLGPTFQIKHNMPLFPNATLATIPSTGHRFFVEQPNAALAAVQAYLQEYSTP